MNKLLTEEDAREILEELIPAQNESYMLGITLNLPVSQVNSIQYEFRDSKQRLLQTIIAFLRQESKPTWSVIVAALRSLAVNQQALANRVEKAHVHEPRDTCAPLETSDEIEITTSYVMYVDTGNDSGEQPPVVLPFTSVDEAKQEI